MPQRIAASFCESPRDSRYALIRLLVFISAYFMAFGINVKNNFIPSAIVFWGRLCYMKINYELLRASVREHVATEAEDNLSQWCKQGKPILKQSTVHKFLAGVRGVGMGLFLALCERMNTKPSFFYSALTSDDLRDKLSLLSEMAADPIFPFGKEDLFYNLADQIDSLYHKYLEAKKTKVQ